MDIEIKQPETPVKTTSFEEKLNFLLKIVAIGTGVRVIQSGELPKLMIKTGKLIIENPKIMLYAGCGYLGARAFNYNILGVLSGMVAYDALQSFNPLVSTPAMIYLGYLGLKSFKEPIEDAVREFIRNLVDPLLEKKELENFPPWGINPKNWYDACLTCKIHQMESPRDDWENWFECMKENLPEWKHITAKI